MYFSFCICFYYGDDDFLDTIEYDVITSDKVNTYLDDDGEGMTLIGKATNKGELSYYDV